MALAATITNDNAQLSSAGGPSLFARLGLARVAACLWALCYFVGPAAASVHRLAFPRGSQKLVAIGVIDSARRSQDYELAGRRGEKLTISLRDLVPRGRRPFDHLATMYHITFPSGRQFGMKGYEPFAGLLTETGCYRITVEPNMMASARNRGRFELTLTRAGRV